ncbi:AaceriACL046Cp [[Ashbya] aceris (nom. inval.)]|nr:AaceriACL046Cp [[Ashbya] aceris (nom. inval.)]
MAHVEGEYSVQRGVFGAEAPLTEQRLVSLVEQAFEKGAQLGECVEEAVTRLAAASSQHKFVVTATEIRGAGAAGQTLQSHAGAAWDGKRDGAHSLRIQREDADVLVTVVWLAR